LDPLVRSEVSSTVTYSDCVIHNGDLTTTDLFTWVSPVRVSWESGLVRNRLYTDIYAKPITPRLLRRSTTEHVMRMTQN